ncbi:MAG TPA: hypothetical protein VEI06_16885 [Gemmatimonadaceae bacterium]|nr:hypothetical protein [Gemmatimonadaceae bacterium]
MQENRIALLVVGFACAACLSAPVVAQLAPENTSVQGEHRAIAPGRVAELPTLRVEVDSTHGEIRLIAGPLDLPAMPEMSGHQGEDVSFQIAWPADGWIQGWRGDVLDDEGRPLPHRLIHHIGLVDLERRALLYGEFERLLAVGGETEPVALPRYIGASAHTGERFLLFLRLHNGGARDIHHARAILTLRWAPRGTVHPTEVFPFYADVHNTVGGTTQFDLPLGRSTVRYEFVQPVTGGLVVAGGHMHDYAREVRLEDAESGKVLVRLEAKRDAAGHVQGVGRFIFGFHEEALRLEAGHCYRIVAEYDNTSGHPIADGGMASLSGPFVPDDAHQWPRPDMRDRELQRDMTSLGLSVTADAGEPPR